MKVAILAVAMAILASILLIGSSRADFVGDRKNTSRVIVFVHGFHPSFKLEEEDATWASDLGFWPAIVAADPLFVDSDVFVAHYNASLNPDSMRIEDLVHLLREQLVLKGIHNFQDIVFVVHSLGGIVVRKLLLEDLANERLFAGKVKGLLLFASPMAGSGVANLATAISSSSTLWQMNESSDPETFLARLRREWIDRAIFIRSRCAYESRPERQPIAFNTPIGPFMLVFGTMIVESDSAERLCNDGFFGLPASHTNIVRFAGSDLPPHSTLVDFYLSIFPDAKLSLARGQVVLAQCRASTFGDEGNHVAASLLEHEGLDFHLSKVLPDDWTNDLDSERFIGSSADVVVIHFSCFQEGPEEPDESKEESRRDLNRFLVQLAEDGVGVVLYSRAIPQPVDGQVKFFDEQISRVVRNGLPLDQGFFLLPVRRGSLAVDMRDGLVTRVEKALAN